MPFDAFEKQRSQRQTLCRIQGQGSGCDVARFGSQAVTVSPTILLSQAARSSWHGSLPSRTVPAWFALQPQAAQGVSETLLFAVDCRSNARSLVQPERPWAYGDLCFGTSVA